MSCTTATYADPPALPIMTPMPDPCDDIPYFGLEAVHDMFRVWDLGSLREFEIEHYDITVKVESSEIDERSFFKHVAKIPRSILKTKKMHKRMPVTLKTCAKVDELIAEATAYHAIRS